MTDRERQAHKDLYILLKKYAPSSVNFEEWVKGETEKLGIVFNRSVYRQVTSVNPKN
jgi:hypothetical protein